jgi:hypothetical protein
MSVDLKSKRKKLEQIQNLDIELMKALEHIKVLPAEERSHSKETIVNCSKNDQNEIVKESCSTFRF